MLQFSEDILRKPALSPVIVGGSWNRRFLPLANFCVCDPELFAKLGAVFVDTLETCLAKPPVNPYCQTDLFIARSQIVHQRYSGSSQPAAISLFFTRAA